METTVRVERSIQSGMIIYKVSVSIPGTGSVAEDICTTQYTGEFTHEIVQDCYGLPYYRYELQYQGRSHIRLSAEELASKFWKLIKEDAFRFAHSRLGMAGYDSGCEFFNPYGWGGKNTTIEVWIAKKKK